MHKYIILLVLLSGCTGPSTKLAIEKQREIENRQDEIVENMNYSLLVYQYQDLRDKIHSGKADDDYLSSMWNARNGLQNMMIQWERIRALRLITIDTYLYAQQNILDLKYKRMREWLNEVQPTSQPVTP